MTFPSKPFLLMICACATIQVQAEPLISQGALLNQDMKYENGKLGRWERGSSEFETVELSKSETHDGQASIHLKDSSCGKSNETLRLVLWPKELEAAKGKALRVSAWVKKLSGDGGVGIGFWLKRANGEMLSKGEEVQAKGDWAKYSATMDVPDDCVLLMLNLSCAGGWGRTGEAYFSQIELELVAAPGSPASNSSARPSADVEGSRFPIYSDSFVSQWGAKSWGGFALERVEGAAKSGGEGIRLMASKETSPFAGFSIASSALNRDLDVSAYAKAGGFFEFSMKPFIPFNLCGFRVDAKAAADAGNGWSRCRVPLSSAFHKLDMKRLGELFFQFPEKLPKGTSILFDDIAVVAPSKVPAAPFVFKNSADKDFLDAASQEPGVVSKDSFDRPSIKDGTFVFKNGYFFFDGPWFDNALLQSDFGPGSFKKSVASLELYNKAFDKKIGDELGLSSIQISAAETIPMCQALGFPIRKLDNFKAMPGFYKGLGGMPAVLDFAWINYCAKSLKAEPGFPLDAFQQNSSWHEFIPLCPEHPKGREIYSEYMKRGVWFALKNGLNPYVYEIFNESSYDCRCEFNKRSFLAALKKRYGTIADANKVWGASFKSFEDAVFMKGKYESQSGLWADWCKFSGERYAEILREYASVIREVDKRDRVYFTEQLAFSHVFEFSGAGMDYVKVAEASDVLCLEGGFKFGNSSKPRTKGDEMADVMNTGTHEYSMVADLFVALSKNRKPVVNHEHYCQRMEFGKRVPSKASDITTALWGEIFHGVSASYLYAWGRRAWEWNSFEEAKAQVINGGYKAAHLLNPYAYPPEFFDGFKNFRAELEPLKDMVLPMPRLKAAKIAFVHSYPTLRQAGLPPQIDNSKILSSWYGALLAANYPVEALFEEDIPSTDLSKYQALAIPCMRNSYAATVPALAKYVANGGAILYGPSSFEKDEYGKALARPSFLRDPKVRMISDLRTLDKELKAVPVAKYLDLIPLDGKPLLDVEAQIIDRGDAKLVMLVNWLDEGTRLLRVKVNGLPVGFSVVDPSAKKAYSIEKDGVLVSLPPQTRLLLLFRKGAPPYQLLSPKDVKAGYDAAHLEDSKTAEARRKAEIALAEEYSKAREYEAVDPAKCVFVDLSKAVNMGFQDEIDGDRKGGWFDQGSNDLRSIPVGVGTFSRLPFKIIDPKLNDGRSALVLYGTARDYFPAKAEGISVGSKAANLYFLHTAGWDAPNGAPCLFYKIHYADGSSIEISVEFGVKIGGWWNPKALPEAKIALDTENPVCKHVGLYCFRWRNPHPEKTIAALDVISAKTGVVPAIVAVTVERP